MWKHSSYLISIIDIFSRLSRARHISECIWHTRKSVANLQVPLCHEPHRAIDIVLATVTLHNFLRFKTAMRQLITPLDSLDVEDIPTSNYISSYIYILKIVEESN